MSSYGRLHKKEQFPQEFIPKNPCRKVEQPIARKPCKKNHSPEEIRKFIQSLSFRDKINMHGFVVVGLRPGELFALRWKDIEPGQIMIDEAVYRNELGDPKAEASNAYVAIPKSLEMELAIWKESRERTNPDDFVFEARYHHKPMDNRSYLRRFLKPAAKKAGIEGLTYQSLRRTFATRVQKHGTVKDL